MVGDPDRAERGDQRCRPAADRLREDDTRALGIDVDLLLSGGMMLGAGLAGLAGGLALPLVGATSTMGGDMLGIAFVVLVIGGLGSLYGSVAAGVLA